MRNNLVNESLSMLYLIKMEFIMLFYIIHEKIFYLQVILHPLLLNIKDQIYV